MQLSSAPFSLYILIIYGVAVADENSNTKMAAWQIHSYGGLDQLKFSRDVKKPKVAAPNDVLVKVQAASLNTLDVFQVNGYGRVVFKYLRLFQPNNLQEFPMILGRDFSGIVVDKGSAVKDLSIGDSVWGLINAPAQGSHAEYILVDRTAVGLRPPNLSYVEAASVLFAALTAYSGLVYKAGLQNNMKDKRVLVLGAAGGVGSMAVQILKAGGAFVITTSSTNALPLMRSLGVDIALDYKAEDYEAKVTGSGPYDTILDCAGLGEEYASKYKWEYSKYVTFIFKILSNIDESGIIIGGIQDLINWSSLAASSIFTGKSIRWAFIIPTPDGIEHMRKLVLQNQLKPIVSKVFGFDETPEAYKAMAGGHVRGKIVIDIAKES